MSGRKRMSSFREEIAATEKAIAAKEAAKKPTAAAKPAAKVATNDDEIKNWALDIKNQDNSTIMSQIKALEDSIASDDFDTEVTADQNDDAMKNNPLEAEGKDMEVEADDEDFDDDDFEVAASDDDDEDDMKTAGEEDVKDEDTLAGVEDQISDTNDQVIEEVKPEAKGAQPIDVAKKPMAASDKRASIIKEATARLDRLANYLEKKGNKKLAYRLDKIADALEAKVKNTK